MLDTLTMAEIYVAEDIAGKSIRELANDTAPNSRLMTAVAFVIAKRTEPTLNFEKFEAEMTLTKIMEILGSGDEAEKK